MNADKINSDGFSVVLAFKFLCKPLPERIAGIDLMQCLIEISALKGYSLYFGGAKETVVNKMLNNIKNSYSSINICGFRK